MGMSSSQARLLTLTARMHDIEYKAQRIEAQKLQMANESRRAYESYLEALDATKIQYKSINNDGSITFRDATLNALENGAIPGYEGEASNKTFLLKNGFTNEIYVTPQFADAFHIVDGETIDVGTLDEYLENNGLTRTKPIYETIYETDYTSVASYDPAKNVHFSNPITPVEGTNAVWTFQGITKADIPEPGVRYTVSGNLPAPKEGHSSIEMISLRDSALSLNDMFRIQDNGTRTTITYNVSNIAENLYLLEAASRGYDSSAYDENKARRVTLYQNIINTYFNLNDPSATNMSNMEVFVRKLANILNGDNLELSATLFDTINGQDDGNKLSAIINNISSGDVDVTGVRSEFEALASGISDKVVDPQYVQALSIDVTSLNLKGATGCSKNDIIAYVAQAVLTAGGWSGDTLDSLMSGTSTNARFNELRALSNLDLMKISYLASKQPSMFNNFINNIISGESSIAESLEGVKRDWNNIEVADDDFSSTNRILNDNGEQSNEYQYNYSKQDIMNKIVYDIVTRNNSNDVNDATNLFAAFNSNDQINALTEAQWVSLATYCEDETAWANIVAQFESAASGGSFNVDAYLNNIPDGITAKLNPNARTNLTFEPGTPEVVGEPGVYKIPSKSEVAMNILVAFQKNGVEITDEQRPGVLDTIMSKLNSSSYSDRDIAEINKLVCAFLQSSSSHNDDIDSLYSSFIDNIGTFAVPHTYSDNYIFEVDPDIRAGEPTYGKKAVQHETGRYTWDTSNPRYKELEKEYYMLKSLEGCTFKVIEEELCNSTEFVSNWLTLNEGYLLEFDNSLYEMVDTNVAVTTSLQEVSDEKDLKKAEAQYEADMRRIDQKDRRYDTQLAALDTERNAVKLEMETVKTVAKDNVDRTFRLFS